jgi:hypothetical protein
MLRAAVIILLIALLPANVRTESRVALPIGNEGFTTEIGRLRTRTTMWRCSTKR